MINAATRRWGRRLRAWKLARRTLALAASCPEALPHLVAAIEKLNPVAHSPDFASVRWFAPEPFHFSPTQAAVVRLLWQAWEQGGLALNQHWLLTEAGSECERLHELFNGHPAWKTMIVSPARGVFALQEPPRSPAKKPSDVPPST